jgi:hypothetical protein
MTLTAIFRARIPVATRGGPVSHNEVLERLVVATLQARWLISGVPEQPKYGHTKFAAQLSLESRLLVS